MLVRLSTGSEVLRKLFMPYANSRFWNSIGFFAGVAIACVGAASIAQSPVRKAARQDVVVSERALAIHASAPVIDGHNDLPWVLRSEGMSSFDVLDVSAPQPKYHTDIPRLRKGGIGAQFWSAYVPADTAQTGTALRDTLEQIDLIHRLVARYPDTFELARSADDIERIRRSGKIASLIGVEGGHSIQNSLGALRQLHKLGARYMTLTHSENTPWADSATDEPEHGGLSAFGEEVVREMNRLGMLVDLSHVSPDTMRDALRVSRAPVIFSHSSAFSIAPHPRNVPDEILESLPANGGVVMVNFFSGFLVPESARAMADMFAADREMKAKFPVKAEYDAAVAKWKAEHPMTPGTVHIVADHIDHIVAKAGIDHVGLGSDFDGVSMLPKQLEDVSCYPNITQELLNRGYSEEQVRKVLGENVLRVLRGAERAATTSE